MNCTNCGVEIPAGSAFCPGCGASAPPVAPPSAYPAPSAAPGQAAPVAPTQQMPVAQAPAAQPAAPYQQPPVPQPAAPYQQQPAAPYAPPQPAPRKGLSGGAIAAIVGGVLALILLAVVGGLLAFGIFSLPVRQEIEQVVDETPQVVEEPAAEQPAVEEPPAPDDGIVTDTQARDTVTAFMDARMARDVERSNSYCNEDFLKGEWSDLLSDPTWYPERYEIVNSSPDLMYVHVVVLESWPSGDEHWIYSVYLDPDSGTPLIGGTIDPAHAPELIPQ